MAIPKGEIERVQRKLKQNPNNDMYRKLAARYNKQEGREVVKIPPEKEPRVIKTESYKEARRREAVARGAMKGLERKDLTSRQRAILERTLEKVEAEERHVRVKELQRRAAPGEEIGLRKKPSGDWESVGITRTTRYEPPTPEPQPMSVRADDPYSMAAQEAQARRALQAGLTPTERLLRGFAETPRERPKERLRGVERRPFPRAPDIREYVKISERGEAILIKGEVPGERFREGKVVKVVTEGTEAMAGGALKAGTFIVAKAAEALPEPKGIIGFKEAAKISTAWLGVSPPPKAKEIPIMDEEVGALAMGVAIPIAFAVKPALTSLLFIGKGVISYIGGDYPGAFVDVGLGAIGLKGGVRVPKPKPPKGKPTRTPKPGPPGEPLVKKEGVAIDVVEKVDRYGNVYKSLEAKPEYAKTGQMDLFGKPARKVAYWEEGKGPIERPIREGIKQKGVSADVISIKFTEKGVSFYDPFAETIKPLVRREYPVIERTTGDIRFLKQRDIKVKPEGVYVRKGKKWHEAEGVSFVEEHAYPKGWLSWFEELPGKQAKLVKEPTPKYKPLIVPESMLPKPPKKPEPPRKPSKKPEGVTILEEEKVGVARIIEDYPLAQVHPQFEFIPGDVRPTARMPKPPELRAVPGKIKEGGVIFDLGTGFEPGVGREFGARPDIDFIPVVRVEDKFIFEGKRGLRPRQEQAPSTIVSIIPIQKVELRPRQEQRQEPIQEPKLEQVPKTVTVTGIPGIIWRPKPRPGPPPPTPPPTITRIPRFGEEEEEDKKEDLFGLSVRRRGKFSPIGKFPTAKEAVTAGMMKVSTTAAASFKVTPSDMVRVPSAKFRKSIKEPGVFIEKRQFRIETPGEKREIPFKALMTRKGRRMF